MTMQSVATGLQVNSNCSLLAIIRVVSFGGDGGADRMENNTNALVIYVHVLIKLIITLHDYLILEHIYYL
jgi:hypothetical protein